MTASAYIKNKLTELSVSIKGVRLIYGYDGVAAVHVVEVAPDTIYDNDIFIRKEKEILDKFLELYPKESIAFIKEGDVPGVENELFRISGDDYSDIYSLNLTQPGYQNVVCFSVAKAYPVSFDITDNAMGQDLIKGETIPTELKSPVDINVNPKYSVDFSPHHSPLAA